MLVDYFGASFEEVRVGMREKARRKAGLSPRQQRQRLRNYHPEEGQREAFQAARDFARDFIEGRNDGSGLLLLGGVGCGKTHLAAAVLNAVIDNTPIPEDEVKQEIAGFHYGLPTPAWMRMAFVNVVTLLEKLRATYRTAEESDSDLLDRYRRASLLVLDDLGAEKPSEWVRERLFSLIDHRYAYGLPTVITTNASPRELREQLGERIADRVRAMCRSCAITAKSHRRPGEPGQPEELEGQDFDRPICIPEPEEQGEREKSIYERMQE